jgi:beta-lactamase regulating signal transducer with metallopeptidase domain
MNAFIESLVVWLMDFAWMATVLLVAALTMRWLLRDAASRVRLAWGTWLAIAAAAAIAALPWWPRVAVEDLLPQGARQKPVALVPSDEAGFQSIGPPPMEVEALPNEIVMVELPATFTPPTGGQVDWIAVVALAWTGTVLAALVWIVLGLWQARRLIRRSVEAPAWIVAELWTIVGPKKRPPDVRTTEHLTTAVALGALRPRIVLPLASAVESNAVAVRAALAHEWAHIRHGDLWLLALERTLVPLLAVHPLFWWLRRVTRLDQELLADAAAAGEQPVEYAEALLAWAGSAQPPNRNLTALAMWDRPSHLTRRVNMILDPNRKSSSGKSRLRGWMAVALLLALAVSLSVFSVGPSIGQDTVEPPRQAPADAPPPPLAAENAPLEKPGAAPLKDDVQFLPPGPEFKRPPLQLAQQILMDVTFLSLDKKALGEEGLDLTALIKEASERAPKKSSSGILATELNPEPATHLQKRLLEAKGVKVMSRPKIATLDGQQAQIVIGGEVPIVEIAQSFNGNPLERRIEYRGVGQHFRVTPEIVDDDVIALEIEAVTTELHPDQTQPEGQVEKIPRLMSRAIRLRVAIELGNTLLLLSDPPQAGSADKAEGDTGGDLHESQQSLMILLTPTKIENRASDVFSSPAAANAARELPKPSAYATVPPGFAPVRSPAKHAAEGDAELAQQLREIRVVIERLAAEREESREENAALRAQLNELKRAWTQPSSQPKPAPVLPIVPAPPTRAKPQPVTGTESRREALERRLLEIDLQAAELELEAAQEDLERVEQLRESKVISEEEARSKRLAADRARLQVARIKVQLEALQSTPPVRSR